MRVFLLAAAVLLALPSLSWAQTTFHADSACTTVARSFTVDGVVVKGLDKGETIYNCQDGDSGIFVALVSFTLEYDPADDSTGTDAGEIFLRRCSENTASDDNCEKVLVDNDGNGIPDDEALNGDPGPTEQRRFIYDLPPGLYYIDESIAEGGGNNAITKLTATGR